MSYDLSTLRVFSVQDRSGTVAQVTINEPLPDPVEVGDSGTITGLVRGVSQSLAFTVSQVLDPNNFSISTVTADGARGELLTTNWPSSPGTTISWLTGSNVRYSPAADVVAVNPSNAYVTTDALSQYANSTGQTFPASPIDAVETAIVVGSAFLDQRFKWKGTRLQCWLIGPAANGGYLDLGALDFSWFGGFYGPGGLGLGSPFLVEATSMQATQHPRAGLIDSDGNVVFGIHLAVQQACCECALRVLSGINLSPDFDATVFGTPGAVVESTEQSVGPIRVVQKFDTKFGTGFFPTPPKITRMLSSAGLLVASGGRSICR